MSSPAWRAFGGCAILKLVELAPFEASPTPCHAEKTLACIHPASVSLFGQHSLLPLSSPTPD
eukprot:7789897-Alexandrium_andersonii.AAC.1